MPTRRRWIEEWLARRTVEEGDIKDSTGELIPLPNIRPPDSRRGEASKNSKLTEDLVRTIREERRLGFQLKEISERYGLAISTVSQAALGRTWAHVK